MYGLKLSPRDDRDFKLSNITSITSTHPVEYKTNLPQGFIQNQFGFNMCVAFQLAYERRLTELKQSAFDNKFSEGWIYANRDTSDWQGTGMYMREGLKQLQKYGTCKKDNFNILKEYPDIKVDFNNIKSKYFQEAFNHRISGYFVVNKENIEEIKYCIKNFGYCFVSIPIYQSFHSERKNGIIPIPKEGEKFYGYHAVGLYGWDRYGCWYMLNSWGNTWNGDGTALLPCTFPLTEVWGIMDGIIDDVELYPYFCLCSNSQGFVSMESANNFLNLMKQRSSPYYSEFAHCRIRKANNKYFVIAHQYKDYEIAKLNKTNLHDLIPLYLEKEFKVILNIYGNSAEELNSIYTDLINYTKLPLIIEKLNNKFFICFKTLNSKIEAQNYINNYISVWNEGMDYLEIIEV